MAPTRRSKAAAVDTAAVDVAAAPPSVSTGDAAPAEGCRVEDTPALAKRSVGRPRKRSLGVDALLPSPPAARPAARPRRAAPTAAPTAPALSEYELERAANILRNETYLKSLGITPFPTGPKSNAGRPKGTTKRGAAAKRPKVDLRRSTRHTGNAALVALPADFREPTGAVGRAAADAAPRGDYALAEADPAEAADVGEADEAESESGHARAFAAILAGAGAAEARRGGSDAAYANSLASLAIREVDVAKVTKGRTYSIAFHPGASKLLLAAGDIDGVLGVWDCDDADDVRCVRTWASAHSRPVVALAWGGDALYSAGYDSVARALHFGAAKSTVVCDARNLEYVGDVCHAAFVDVCADVFLAHNDGSLTRFDPRSSSTRPVLTLQAHDKKCAHVAFRPSGGFHVATSSNDGTVKLWDARKLGKKSGAVWSASSGTRAVHGICWTANGDALGAVSYDDTLKVYDAAALASTKAAVTQVMAVTHNNHTGRYLTPLKPVFDPHSPAPALIVGSMTEPRRIDIVRFPASAKRGVKPAALSASDHFSLGDGGDVFRTITSLHDVHPTMHVIAGTNNSGRVSLWRTAR
ncbi:WD40-repeat-containing domain protein [Pelagophyceae sp. CCMP2097]|nr:WD40-repeat-containing domain protein [Pelagophyceae sp. CCMP2097]